MKDFKALATERYSVRKFDPRPVEQEKVDMLLAVARLAPTAHNYQPQRLLVLNTEDSLNKLKDCTNGHFNAPLAIIVCYDNTVSWKREYDDADMGGVDASIVGSHIMFTVADIGLGTTRIAHFDPAKVRKAYNLPDNIIPVAIFPIGYPHPDCVPAPGHTKRFDVSEFTIYNSF